MTPESDGKSAALQADPMTPEPMRIGRVRRETYDTFTVELESAGGSPPQPFEPGQFNMLYVFGTGEIPISISGDPGKKDTILHTTRVVGKVTRAMHALKKGNTIGVRGPYGTHWPMAEAAGRDMVVVAGGIGLAPLRPVVYSVLSDRARFGRFALLYGCRTPADILFKRELQKWRGKLDVQVDVTVDHATASADWRGKVGVVTELVPRAPFDPDNTVAMICGPEIMMRYTIYALRERGLPDERIYVSMERNMQCGIGHCGHCQLGHSFVCKDGPVYRFDEIRKLFDTREA
jgi:NAD(P)H-flavin reductase